MRIRFLTSIASASSVFHYGQVIDVAKPTDEMLAWLKPGPDGSRRAEVVREDASEAKEHAVTSRGRGRSGWKRDTACATTGSLS